jgi:hypothetical protein
MKRALAGIVFSIAALFAVAPQAVWAKSAKDCEAEYKANKDAIKGAKQKKKDFITACKAGTETIPGATAAPAPAPAPQAAPAPSRQRSASPPPVSHTTTSGFEYTSEAQAKGRCPTGTVVWVNTKTGVYHFAGTHNYGTTKAGVYMCETDTAAAGYRAAKNEKHP